MIIYGILIFIIFFPIFILAINKDFKNTFSKVNSHGFDVVIELIIGIIYFLLIFIGFFMSTTESTFMIILGIIIYVFSIFCTYLGYYTFFKNKKTLINSGIYKFSRNPTYLFSFIAIFGVSIMTRSAPIFLLLCIQILLTHKIILNEEKELEKEFGKKYIEYKKKVGRYF